ncbi:hypothetical protein [Paraburkholderia sp. MM6662-R1]|uniref:hypothetical protein n=3 Tax=unclassified Paraburkholderia TaxID=2615204 RepID=UPI003D1E97F0
MRRGSQQEYGKIEGARKRMVEAFEERRPDLNEDIAFHIATARASLCRCLVASAMTAALAPALLEVSAATAEPMVKAVVMVKVVEAVETAAKEYAWLAARRTPGIELARITRIRRARVVITWLRSAIYRAKQQHGKQNLCLHDANLPYPILSILTTIIHSQWHGGGAVIGWHVVRDRWHVLRVQCRCHGP